MAFAEATSITRKALMQFLEQLEYVEETQDGVQGSSWVEMALLFEIRQEVYLPRRWPPSLTSEE